MKAITRRLRRLEERLAPQANEHAQRAADIIRERRRRRLEAAGLPFDDLDWKRITAATGPRLSIAETLRMGRQRLRERACARGRIATDMYT